MGLYHWIREWSAPAHVTMWTEIQAIATILAFGAAAWYARIAKRQLDAFLAEARIGHKPIVFTVRDILPDQPLRKHYFLLNVGKGTAINVWYADKPTGADTWRVQSLGALGAGQNRLLVNELEQPLRDDNGDHRHIIAAEGVASRTTRWTLTGNARGTDQGSTVTGCLIRLRNPHRDTLEAILTDEGDFIFEQLTAVSSHNA